MSASESTKDALVEELKLSVKNNSDVLQIMYQFIEQAKPDWPTLVKKLQYIKSEMDIQLDFSQSTKPELDFKIASICTIANWDEQLGQMLMSHKNGDISHFTLAILNEAKHIQCELDLTKILDNDCVKNLTLLHERLKSTSNVEKEILILFPHASSTPRQINEIDDVALSFAKIQVSSNQEISMETKEKDYPQPVLVKGNINALNVDSSSSLKMDSSSTNVSPTILQDEDPHMVRVYSSDYTSSIQKFGAYIGASSELLKEAEEQWNRLKILEKETEGHFDARVTEAFATAITKKWGPDVGLPTQTIEFLTQIMSESNMLDIIEDTIEWYVDSVPDVILDSNDLDKIPKDRWVDVKYIIVDETMKAPIESISNVNPSSTNSSSSSSPSRDVWIENSNSDGKIVKSYVASYSNIHIYPYDNKFTPQTKSESKSMDDKSAIFFHGTSGSSGASIIKNGMDLNKAIKKKDFNVRKQAFYVGSSFFLARKWAHDRFSNEKHTAVIMFDITINQLKEEYDNFHDLREDPQKWLSVVTTFRSTAYGQLSAEFAKIEESEWIFGPIAEPDGDDSFKPIEQEKETYIQQLAIKNNELSKHCHSLIHGIYYKPTRPNSDKVLPPNTFQTIRKSDDNKMDDKQDEGKIKIKDNFVSSSPSPITFPSSNTIANKTGKIKKEKEYYCEKEEVSNNEISSSFPPKPVESHQTSDDIEPPTNLADFLDSDKMNEVSIDTQRFIDLYLGDDIFFNKKTNEILLSLDVPSFGLSFQPLRIKIDTITISESNAFLDSVVSLFHEKGMTDCRLTDFITNPVSALIYPVEQSSHICSKCVAVKSCEFHPNSSTGVNNDSNHKVEGQVAAFCAKGNWESTIVHLLTNFHVMFQNLSDIFSEEGKWLTHDEALTSTSCTKTIQLNHKQGSFIFWSKLSQRFNSENTADSQESLSGQHKEYLVKLHCECSSQAPLFPVFPAATGKYMNKKLTLACRKEFPLQNLTFL